MARRSRIQFGDKLLERALQDFGDDVLEKVREIIQTTGLIIYNQATELAPVAEVDGGNLKRSISFYSSIDGMSITITVGAQYAIYVEFGTGIYAVGGDGRKTPWVYWSEKLDRWVWTRGMAAQPFWFPSIDQGRRYFKKEMRQLRG